MSEHSSFSASQSFSDEKARFELLKQQGNEFGDVYSFQLCESLLLKLEQVHEAQGEDSLVFRKLIQRFSERVTHLENMRTERREACQATIAEIKANHPDHYANAVKYRHNGEFAALERLSLSLQDSSSDKSLSLIKGLKGYLEDNEWSHASIEQIGLDALLYDNDRESENDEDGTEQIKPLRASQGLDEGLETLRSLQNYREYLARVVTENMVRQVINEDPENAGPLNPQRLMVRTLSAMKDISPAYVNRVVPYFDSLLCLEESVRQLKNK